MTCLDPSPSHDLTYQIASLMDNNPDLLLLNVPQIPKTRVRVKFGEISDWPI